MVDPELIKDDYKSINKMVNTFVTQNTIQI